MRCQMDFFAPARIAASGQCFRWHSPQPGLLLIPAFGRKLKLRVLGAGCFEADCDEAEWATLWANYFDEGADYAGWAAGIDPEDAYLNAAARAAGGIRILRQELWETAASFVLSQNNNIPRIRGCIERLCGGEDAPFPTPEALLRRGPAGLEGCGLGYRAAYLEALARTFAQEEAWTARLRAADYEEARRLLMERPGIGAKVADCICLFGLGHKEAFPIDVWMKRIMSAHYPGGFPLERYRGHAGVLQQWMFFYERKSSLPHGGARGIMKPTSYGEEEPICP